MKENLLVLQVQITCTSASGELQKLKAQQEEFTTLAAVHGQICNQCTSKCSHQNHMKTKAVWI